MLKFVIAAVTGMALTGNVYLAGWKDHCPFTSGSATEDCCVMTVDDTTVVVHSPDALDMKNTVCVVMKEAVGKSTKTVEYQGKIYHICCGDCVAEFNKEPQVFVKKIEAAPLEYGLKP